MSVARGLAVALLLAQTSVAQDPAQNEVRLGDVIIHHWPGQERLARALLPPAAGLKFPGLPEDILDRGVDVDVFLAPDAERFDSLTGGRAPDWGAGVAFPTRGMIVVPGYSSSRAGAPELPHILRHELAHVALQRHLRDASVPFWFTEGYATWSAGQFEDQGWQLRLALASSRAPTLDSLTLAWPLLETDARTAYLLSASAVQYLYSLGSPQAFERFLDIWAETGDFEDALRTVYVVSSPQFERLWREHVKRTYGWLQVIVQTSFLWTILAIIVITLFIMRRRRDRRRLEQLRSAEIPDTPAYWLEPEGNGALPDAGEQGSQRSVGDQPGDEGGQDGGPRLDENTGRG